MFREESVFTEEKGEQKRKVTQILYGKSLALCITGFHISKITITVVWN